MLKKETAAGNRKAGDDVICPICQCEMFEGLDFDKDDHTDIDNYTKEQIIGRKGIDEVILMKKCKDHQFHAECLEA